MSNDISDILSEVFHTKTASAATSEDLQKQADLEFFTALCKEQGINVEHLDDPTVQRLWKVAMDVKKEAAEKEDGEAPPFPPKKDKKDGEDEKEKEANAKVAAATAEWQEKRAAAIKVAEAEAMGRIMAHSCVAELRKIASEMGGDKPPFPPKKEGKDDKEEKGDKEEKEKEASQKRAAALLATVENAKQASAAPGVTTTPNFDELAAHRAIDLLKTAGIDETEAFNKVNAAYILGLKESVKMASAANPDDALHVRALEICEAAGYQVNWAA